jgi:hypothetical protein
MGADPGLSSQGRVNQEKLKLTAKQVTREVMTFITAPNGDKVRFTDHIVIDFHVARLEITNDWIQEGALASRLDTMLVGNVSTPVNEINAGRIGSELKVGTRSFFQIDQYLNMATNKAIFTGAVLDINMDLFEHISNATLAQLKRVGVVEGSVGMRPLEIMRPLLRQLIIKMANRYLRDLYGSPYFKKEFHVDQLRDAQPFMYVTVSMIFWVWRLCGNQFVNPMFSNFLRAALKMGAPEYDLTLTPAENFSRDIYGKKIMWSEYFSRGAAAKETNDKVIDLNYIVLTGTSVKDICNRLCAFTEPRMDAEQLLGLAETMLTKKALVQSPYKRVSASQLRQAYVYQELPEPERGFLGRKNFNIQCPPDLLNGRPPYMLQQDQPLTEADLPRESSQMMPIVSFERKGKFLAIMPGAVELYQAQQINQALQQACVCSGLTPGKYLLGATSAKDPTRLDYLNLEREHMDELIVGLDKMLGWEYPPGTTDPVWTGDPNIPPAARPHPRSKGIRVNMRNAMCDTEALMMMHTHLEPVDVDTDLRRRTFEDSVNAMRSGTIVIENPDDWSATRRHIETGRPLDEPVRTQRFLREQFRRHAQQEGVAAELGISYPEDIIRGKATLEQTWDATNYVPAGSDVLFKRPQNTSSKRRRHLSLSAPAPKLRRLEDIFEEED